MNITITILACIGLACVVGTLVVAVMIGGKSEEVMKDIMDGEDQK